MGVDYPRWTVLLLLKSMFGLRREQRGGAPEGQYVDSQSMTDEAIYGFNHNNERNAFFATKDGLRRNIGGGRDVHFNMFYTDSNEYTYTYDVSNINERDISPENFDSRMKCFKKFTITYKPDDSNVVKNEPTPAAESSFSNETCCNNMNNEIIRISTELSDVTKAVEELLTP